MILPLNHVFTDSFHWVWPHTNHASRRIHLQQLATMSLQNKCFSSLAAETNSQILFLCLKVFITGRLSKTCIKWTLRKIFLPLKMKSRFVLVKLDLFDPYWNEKQGNNGFFLFVCFFVCFFFAHFTLTKSIWINYEQSTQNQPKRRSMIQRQSGQLFILLLLLFFCHQGKEDLSFNKKYLVSLN